MSDRNLRKALLLGEVCKVKDITNGDPPAYDWEEFLDKTGKMILRNQSPTQILQVRTNLYELIVRLIPANIIFQVRLINSAIMEILLEIIPAASSSVPRYSHENKARKGSCGIRASFQSRFETDLPSRSFCRALYVRLQIFHGRVL